MKSDGDIQAAQEYLRKKGQASAEKKAGRIAAEGRVSNWLSATDAAAIVEINCETDFVAKDENFPGLLLARSPTSCWLERPGRCRGADGAG